MPSKKLEKASSRKETERPNRRKVIERSRSKRGLILGGLGVVGVLGAAGGAAWLYLADRLGQLSGRR